MTQEQFIEKLQGTFNNFPETLCHELVKWFNGFTEYQIGQIYDHFQASYKNSYAPRTIGVFWDIAKDAGVSKDDKNYYYYNCHACGQLLPRSTRGCSNCGKNRLDVVGFESPQKVPYLKDNCYQCRIYKKAPKGASCSEYGKKYNGIEKIDSRANNSTCDGCLCKFCCAEAHAIREGDKQRVCDIQGGVMKDDVKSQVKRVIK